MRKSTASAVRSGTYWGYVYLVEGLVERIKAQTEGALEVCATGGLATLIAPDCKAFDRIEPDLTLLGLRAIAEKYAPMARSG